jgi:hypothetical protein
VVQQPHPFQVNLASVHDPPKLINLVRAQLCESMRWEVPLTMKQASVNTHNPKQPPEYDFIHFENPIRQPLHSHQIEHLWVVINQCQRIPKLRWESTIGIIFPLHEFRHKVPKSRIGRQPITRRQKSKRLR